MTLAKDYQSRINAIINALNVHQCECAYVYNSVNQYYLCGIIFDGYILITHKGDVRLCFRKAQDNSSPFDACIIRKAENLGTICADLGITHVSGIMLEADQLNYSHIQRLLAITPNAKLTNLSPIIRNMRTIKSDMELQQIREAAVKHSAIYKQIPQLYEQGMTDYQLQVEIEHLMRQHGSIGIFRAYGEKMDIFMGSVIAGDNATHPAPFDFTMGGQGTSSYMPIGSNNKPIAPNTTIMVDMAGNYSALQTDITRTFAVGKLPDKVVKAHLLSIDICQHLEQTSKQGTACADMYAYAYSQAEKYGLSENFMGYGHQAKFIGHGVGLEINESPVLSPRSKDTLQQNMVIAIEPKFVFPTVGAVGIENTYIVQTDGLEKVTIVDESLIYLN